MPFMAREIPSLFIIRYYFLQGKKSFFVVFRVSVGLCGLGRQVNACDLCCVRVCVCGCSWLPTAFGCVRVLVCGCVV